MSKTGRFGFKRYVTTPFQNFNDILEITRQGTTKLFKTSSISISASLHRVGWA